MRSVYAIYRKEMGHYFVSPVAYVVVAVFLIVAGFFFRLYMGLANDQAMEMAMQGMGSGMDVPAEVLRAFFGLISTLILFLAPMLTMGVYAEERRRGTMELLMTSPITEFQIVLGKFLATLTLFVIMLFPTALYVAYMCFHTDPKMQWALVLTGYLGALLLGASLLAIGSFISSLTESQLIAVVLSFGAILILWVLDFVVRGSDSVAGTVLQYISVIHHYDDFTRGVIDTSSLIYYVSVPILFLFLTVRSIDSIRWRRA
ncbi:MAG TPA: ABC transporter permease subunit [Candidatus Baltobacteraceae bacterium]|nr:ABC transporter permease subunit [Candidatus Baltobacteraceae bacterium]